MRMLKYISCQSRFTAMGRRISTPQAAAASILLSVRIRFSSRRFTITKVSTPAPIISSIRICAL